MVRLRTDVLESAGTELRNLDGGEPDPALAEPSPLVRTKFRQLPADENRSHSVSIVIAVTSGVSCREAVSGANRFAEDNAA